MFSVVGQAWKYVFGADGDTETPAEEDDVDAVNKKTMMRRREFDGVVTHVFSSHGLIDNEVYFSFDHVLGGKRPCVGDKVSVVAVQDHEDGGWHAQQVSMSEDWDNDSETDDHIDKTLPTEVIGQVTQCTDQTGYINNDIYYNLRECTYDYDFNLCKGDWVTVEIVYPDSDHLEKVAKTIKPLLVRTTDGIVSAEKEDHGYLDGEVFYMVEALVDGYRPRKWDPVYYTAVESAQGGCSWRAVRIEPSQKPLVTNLKALQGPLQKSFTRELLADKNGITVTQDTDFGSVSLGMKKSLTLWVKNNGTSPQTFQKCHLSATSSQLKVKAVKLLKEHSAMMKDGCNTTVTGDVLLYPSMSLYINVELEARSPGQDRHLLILTFEGFKIGRYLTAQVTDSMLGMFPQTSPYEGRGGRQGYNRYKQTQENKSTPWMVPGQRLNRSKRTIQLPHRLPQYNVPDELRDTVLNLEDIPDFAPVLQKELSFENYRQKFKHLLHLEEIQMDIDIREFDLHRVCLRHVGEYLGLVVPGLAEGRPSVLLGDKVMLTDPVDPGGPCYEGYVHEILRDEVLLKFNPEFHKQYSGMDYDVVFTFNRGPLRKCHKATEMASQLGENVLFPKCLIPKPPQCVLQGHSKGVSPMSLSKLFSGKPHRGMEFFNPWLNDRQKSAVSRIVQGQGRPLPYILFGPPGTGKTVTVVEAILQVFVQLTSSRIIACAPSNSASDLLAERLHDSGLVGTADMVRLNALQRSEEGIPECIKPYCILGDDLDIACRFRILVTTCVSAGVLYSLGIKSGHFTHVFVDEAGQATEPECMISACLLSNTDGQIVLAGDPQQLGPVLRSRPAKRYGLELSFLERLIHTPLYERNEQMFADHGAYDPFLVTKLVDNYRSHPSILKLPSDLFYHGELLVRADQKLTHTFTEWKELPTSGVPVIFHGVRGEDMREGNSPSWFNPNEAVIVMKYLQSVLNTSAGAITHDDIGIITPYRKQVEKVRLLLDKLDIARVKVGSVEEFQGQERQVIIISTVRSNEEMIGSDFRHSLGFLSSPKRFNVAITRAQALLVVIGNPHILIQDQYWRALIDYCVSMGAYTGCDLPPTSLNL